MSTYKPPVKGLLGCLPAIARMQKETIDESLAYIEMAIEHGVEDEETFRLMIGRIADCAKESVEQAEICWDEAIQQKQN